MVSFLFKIEFKNKNIHESICSLTVLISTIENINSTKKKLYTEAFSEQFKKIGRGFIKILETSQFDLSFNIIFCFGQKFFFVDFKNF
jgi:hypothetical protein